MLGAIHRAPWARCLWYVLRSRKFTTVPVICSPGTLRLIGGPARVLAAAFIGRPPPRLRCAASFSRRPSGSYLGLWSLCGFGSKSPCYPLATECWMAAMALASPIALSFVSC